MRILVSCLQALKPHPLPAHGFWRRYFVNGLAEAGHEMVEIPEVDWAEGIAPDTRDNHARWLADTWTRTVNTLRQWQQQGRGVDLCLFYLYPAQIDESAIRQLRGMGIPCVHFFCDNVREFRTPPSEFRCFDLNWVPEHKAIAPYRKLGLRHVNLPMPCWVAPEHRHLPDREETLARFIGTRDQLRADLLARVTRCDLKLEIRGPAWDSEHPIHQGLAPASFAQRVEHWINLARNQGGMAVWRRVTNRFQSPSAPYDFSAWLRPAAFSPAYEELTRSAAVCLGINRYPSLRFPSDKPDTYSRLRDIEAPMLGACYLTEWTEGIGDLYELGVEIETYRDAEELAAKARDLLADSARRQRMRACALKRAHAEHSIPKIIQRISEKLGLC